jgi:hypothetical protein
MYTFEEIKIKGSYNVVDCIIYKKSRFEKRKSCNRPFSIPVQVLINTSKVLEGSKNKKEVENDLLSIMAPLTYERCSYNTLIEFVTISKLKG